MVSVYIVGDGVREKDTLAILARMVVPGLHLGPGDFAVWHDLHLGKGNDRSGRGYERKLLYVIRRARDRGLQGVIAVVDQDRADKGAGLAKLKKGREKSKLDPTKTSLPCAVGEARPHAEAWLLDDEKAVRATLEMGPNEPVPSGSTKNPKDELNKLFAEHKPRESDERLLEGIAKQLDPARCTHARETGLQEFLDDIRSEFSTFAV